MCSLHIFLENVLSLRSSRLMNVVSFAKSRCARKLDVRDHVLG